MLARRWYVPGMNRLARPLAASLATIATAVALAGCGSSDGTPRSSRPAAAPPWPGTISSVTVGAGPVGLAADSSGAVWVANAQESQVSRVRDGRVDLTVPGIELPLRVAATAGSVWVTSFGAGQLVRVAAPSGRVSARVAVGKGAEGVAAGLGSIWVVAQDDGRLVRVDPNSAKVAGHADVGIGARLVTTGLGAVWVSQFQDGQVLKVDPTSLAVTRSATLCHGPQGLVTTSDAVWVTCTADDVALRLNPADLSVTRRVKLPDAPDRIVASDGGALYVVCQAGPTLVELDGATGQVRRQRALGGAAQLYDQANDDLTVAGGMVWVSSFGENLLRGLPIS
jgi:streptogramin lyase